MSHITQGHRAESDAPTTHSPFLSCLEKPGSAPDADIAGLIWVERMGPVTVAGQSDCILLPEPAGLTVLAATKGSLRIQSAAVTGTLLRGQAVVLPPDSGCCLTAHEPGECLAVVLSGTLVERLMQGHYETGKLFCAAGLGDVLEAGHVLKAAGASTEQISAAAYRLLMRLHETARPYETSSGYPLLVDAGIGIMRQEFAHLYGVDEVAERLGVTTAHFTRLFSQTVGTPPGRFLKQQKLAYAKKMLLLPEMTVTMVAEMTGYSNVNYFSKVFHKETGMTPGEYRKLHQSADVEREDLHSMIQELYL